MELLNATKMTAGYTMGMDPSGRESLVVVVKGTFTLPRQGGKAQLADKQEPLVDADLFSGEPGFSATLYESDFAPVKPRCDVLLSGSAYAPRGRPVERLQVSLRVGSLRKAFDVVGNRVWQASALYLRASPPEPFTVMPISYDNAFGGVDRSHEDPMKHQWYLANVAGVGYHENLDKKYLDGKPLPNTEETGVPVTMPNGKYRPMAFGPIGRSWPPRPKYAGTYDQKWLDEVCPFLPADFDNRYFQCAPPDQQTDYLVGGEEVELLNLTPEGRCAFSLPKIEVPVEFCRKGSYETKLAVCDTLFLQPDADRFLLVWRASTPLRRSIFEVFRVVVGRMPRGWYRARAANKEYYASLADLAASRKEPA